MISIDLWERGRRQYNRLVLAQVGCYAQNFVKRSVDVANQMENGKVRRPVFHHVSMKTTRLQEMVDWYRMLLGMEVICQLPGGAWLTNDEANQRIVLFSTPRLSEDVDRLVHAGLHHIAFEYPSIDDLISTYTRLKALGIEPHLTIDHGMTTAFYYEDPDGNSVALQIDNFGDWAASKEWMRKAPDSAPSIIGIPIDADAWIVARWAGASLEELHERVYAGEFPPTRQMDLHLPL